MMSEALSSKAMKKVRVNEEQLAPHREAYEVSQGINSSLCSAHEAFRMP